MIIRSGRSPRSARRLTIEGRQIALNGGQRLTGCRLESARRSLLGGVLGGRRGRHHRVRRLDLECGTQSQPIGAPRRAETLRRRRRGNRGRRLERRTGGTPADPARRDDRPRDRAGGSAGGDRRVARARDARHVWRQRDGVGRGRAARQGERSHRGARRRPARDGRRRRRAARWFPGALRQAPHGRRRARASRSPARHGIRDRRARRDGSDDDQRRRCRRRVLPRLLRRSRSARARRARNEL